VGLHAPALAGAPGCGFRQAQGARLHPDPTPASGASQGSAGDCRAQGTSCARCSCTRCSARCSTWRRPRAASSAAGACSTWSPATRRRCRRDPGRARHAALGRSFACLPRSTCTFRSSRTACSAGASGQCKHCRPTRPSPACLAQASKCGLVLLPLRGLGERAGAGVHVMHARHMRAVRSFLPPGHVTAAASPSDALQRAGTPAGMRPLTTRPAGARRCCARTSWACTRLRCASWWPCRCCTRSWAPRRWSRSARCSCSCRCRHARAAPGTLLAAHACGPAQAVPCQGAGQGACPGPLRCSPRPRLGAPAWRARSRGTAAGPTQAAPRPATRLPSRQPGRQAARGAALALRAVQPLAWRPRRPAAGRPGRARERAAGPARRARPDVLAPNLKPIRVRGAGLDGAPGREAAEGGARVHRRARQAGGRAHRGHRGGQVQRLGGARPPRPAPTDAKQAGMAGPLHCAIAWLCVRLPLRRGRMMQGRPAHHFAAPRPPSRCGPVTAGAVRCP